MLGVFLGAIIPVVLGAYALRRKRATGRVSEHHSTRPIVREMLGNAQTLLAFLCLINTDVIVARNVLDAHDAGLYAGGLILTKAMLFLPQFVVVVAFPSMSTAHERRQALIRGLTLILVLGAAGVLACALLPQLALVFIGGSEYAEVQDQLWLFAVLGTVLSLLQLLIYSVLARQGTKSVYLVWFALVVLLVVGLNTSTVLELLVVVTAVDTVLFLTLLAISFHRLRLRSRRRASARSGDVAAGRSDRRAPLAQLSMRGLVPAVAGADGHVEGDLQLRGTAHLLAHQRLEGLALAGEDLEDQLVVDLEQHPRPQPGLDGRLVHAQHRHLDQVGCGALDRGVEGHPLCHLATLAVVGGEVGQVTAPARGWSRCSPTAGPRRRRSRGSREPRRRSRSTRPSAPAPRSGGSELRTEAERREAVGEAVVHRLDLGPLAG